MKEVLKSFLSLSDDDQHRLLATLMELCGVSTPKSTLSEREATDLRVRWQGSRDKCCILDAELAEKADSITSGEEITERQASLVRAACFKGEK